MGRIRKPRAFQAFAYSTAAVFAASLNAALITSGDVVEIAPPSDITEGALESNDSIFVFNERFVTLAGAETVDHDGSPGTFATNASLVGGVIAQNTHVLSTFLTFDRVGASPFLTLSGGVTFDRPILGLEVLSASLDGTDLEFGAPGTTYSGDALRGLELSSQDVFTISADRRTLSVTLMTSNAVDNIRVFSQTPEPSTVLLIGLGLLTVGATHRFRRGV